MPAFVPPPYPYDRLAPLQALAEAAPAGLVDLSIGTPCDPPPARAMEAMADEVATRGYPPSIGMPAYRAAAHDWLARRFGVTLATESLAACIGTKEFVAGAPHWLRLRTPERDTVLYPAVSYPSYAMGAQLAGCRAVPVPVDGAWRLRVDAIDPAEAERALCLWVNTPGNPAGGLDDLGAAAAWGRANGVPVLSDECYAEFTWAGPARSILEHGADGVLAVHSLSKRSNFAGGRVGFYAGDAELVHYLAEVRKHAGLMPAGPLQLAGAAAWADDAHVAEQRERYRERLDALGAALAGIGLDVTQPAGGFYLWLPAPEGDAWGLAERLARTAGLLVSPGEFYGPGSADHVRIAAVQPLDRITAALAHLR